MNPFSSVEQRLISGAGRHRRRVLALVCVSALGVAACSSDDDEGADATSAPAETLADTVGSPEPVDSAPDDSVAEPAGSDDTTAAGAEQTIGVDLLEFEIALDGEIAEGPVTFNIENTGQFPHQMSVYRGTYAELPQLDSGAVDNDAVAAADNLGAIEQLAAGESNTLSVEFTPGTYTLLCNLEGGGSSHAARGQVLEVVVG